MADLPVRVLLNVESSDQLDLVVARAKKVGLRLDEAGRLEALGVLVGSIDPAALERLRGIPGVQSVETQQVVRALKN